jgi:hypothetical protein
MAFVTVIAGDIDGSSPTEIYRSWLHQAGTHARARAIGDAHAYMVGTAVLALRDGTMVSTNVLAAGVVHAKSMHMSMRLASPVLQEMK